MNTTPFDPRTRTWARPFPQSLAQHDLVYHSPPEDALQGLPIGNGDLGMLLWTEGSQLVAAINKVDFFDDSPDSGNGAVVGVEYDHEPTLRHGARLIVDFGMPVFDVLYLQQFEARLGLADATVRADAQTPFMTVQATAFASQPDQVLVLTCECQCEDEVALRIVLERFGSRPYPYWYSRFNRDATIGLDGTQTTVQENTILIRQELRALHFVVGARVCGVQGAAELRSRHAGCFTTEKGRTVRFTLLITACTSENAADPRACVLERLDRAAAQGQQALHHAHAQDWERFWQASFLNIPNDYLENIWYMNLYHANSSCRGDYPPRFNNGIWGWNRDVANWVYYFHWNMQNFIWPLHTANHAELTRPYFGFHRRSLSNTLLYAKHQQGRAGAFYADVADRRGQSVGKRWYNQTPGSQIALLFWKHYQYTGDDAFLRTEAWPVIREVARYYASLVVQGEDGVYRTTLCQAYEGSPLFDEVITDTAMIRALMPVAAQCAALVGFDDPEVETWRAIGQGMNDFHTQAMDDDEVEITEDGRTLLKHGLGAGHEALTGQAFTVGIYRKLEQEESETFDPDTLPDYITKPLEGVQAGDRLRSRHGNPARLSYYGTPDPELAPVFPAEIVGLKDRGSEIYNTCVDQVRLHPPTVPPQTQGAGSMAGPGPLCMGWCPYPVVLARLGLADEAAQAVEQGVSTWQFYCQGFSHYGPYDVFTKDCNMRWHINTVTEHATGERFPSPAWPFRHFTLEAVPVACAALNETLLQSHEGLIRLLPSVPGDWSGSFMLAAQGGFIVHAQFENAAAEWVAIESRLGRPCTLAHPWPGGAVTVTVLDEQGQACGAAAVQETQHGPDAALAFPTAAGMMYLVTREPNALEAWNTQPVDFAPNQGVKRLGSAQLGLPRMF